MMSAEDTYLTAGAITAAGLLCWFFQFDGWRWLDKLGAKLARSLFGIVLAFFGAIYWIIITAEAIAFWVRQGLGLNRGERKGSVTQ